MIEQFKDDYHWLSNFYPCEVTYQSITYPTVEHYYVAMKVTDPEIRLFVSQIETPGRAKRYGRKLEKEDKVRADWEEIKFSVMRYGLEQKFQQKHFCRLLLATGDETIQEGNTWNDTYWGVDLDTGEGSNILGKLIMSIRDKLRSSSNYRGLGSPWGL